MDSNNYEHVSQEQVDSLLAKLKTVHGALVTPKGPGAWLVTDGAVSISAGYNAVTKTLTVDIVKHPFWITAHTIFSGVAAQLAGSQSKAPPHPEPISKPAPPEEPYPGPVTDPHEVPHDHQTGQAPGEPEGHS